MELLCLNLSGLQCQMLQGILLPMPDPQVWDPNVEVQTLTPVGEPLQGSYFPVCGSPTGQLWGYFYHESTPPAILMRLVLCLWV